jgi:hypothetical protein
MARGEEAEAMKGGQGTVTGARALGLSVATEGYTGILLGRIEIVIIIIFFLFFYFYFVFVFIFLTVRVALGEVIGGPWGGRGRGRVRAEEAVAPGIWCLGSLGRLLALDCGWRQRGRVDQGDDWLRNGRTQDSLGVVDEHDVGGNRGDAVWFFTDGFAKG